MKDIRFHYEIQIRYYGNLIHRIRNESSDQETSEEYFCFEECYHVLVRNLFHAKYMNLFETYLCNERSYDIAIYIYGKRIRKSLNSVET